MKKTVIQQGIQKLRDITPLFLRQKIGPVISYLLYIFNVYLLKDKKRPHVLSLIDTVDHVARNNCSLIRFGDGEISLIDNLSLAFQDINKELVDKLEAILKSDNDGLLIGIPGIWGKLEGFRGYAYWFNMHHLYRHGHVWKKVLSYDKVYGDTNVTRPYLAYVDRSHAGLVFEKFFSLWKDKDVVLIEGEKSRLGVGNNMFDNVKSLQRILCPPENAYVKYEQIKHEALKIGKDRLILVSLGPTAKVLAYDLFLLGYRVLDIGHIDMEYEMFLRNAEKQEKVEYKYFNEINERDPKDCMDEVYIQQIVARITE